MTWPPTGHRHATKCHPQGKVQLRTSRVQGSGQVSATDQVSFTAYAVSPAAPGRVGRPKHLVRLLVEGGVLCGAAEAAKRPRLQAAQAQHGGSDAGSRQPLLQRVGCKQSITPGQRSAAVVWKTVRWCCALSPLLLCDVNQAFAHMPFEW